MASYSRQIESELLSRLQQFPVVGLLGPRQVGKTTLALTLSLPRRSIVYLDLESPRDRNKLTDPEAYFDQQGDVLTILDEVQRLPELFQVLRGTIDRRKREGRVAGQFLILGSAALDLLAQSSESLAGRISYLELRPLLLSEVLTQQGNRTESKILDQLWLRGGFPPSFDARSDEGSLLWRDAFITTYLERDIPNLGPRIPAETLRRFWTMLAHQQGQLVNLSTFSRSLGVSGQTVARYLDLLVDLLLVRRLPPFAENVGKRLVKTPKLYVRDSGLVHALLSLGTLEQLLGHPVAGGSFEGLVIEHLLAAAPHAQAFFYRTAAGAEIDLVLSKGGKRWAIEIKRSTAPTVSRGFWQGCEDLSVQQRLLVYPGSPSVPGQPDRESYSLGQGLTAMSLGHAVSLVKDEFG